MDTPRLDHLLNSYLDGNLPPEEKHELEGSLLASPDARRQFWRAARLHGALRLLGGQESGAGAAQREPDLPGKDKVIHVGRRFWIGAAAAAAIALVAIAAEFWPSRNTAQGHLAGVEPNTPNGLVVPPESTKPKLSERLFSASPHESASERIAASRNRLDQLRTKFHYQPASRL